MVKFLLNRSPELGGIDLALLARAVLPAYFGENIGKTVFVIEPPLLRFHGYIAVHKKHKMLADRLAVLLRVMRDDGTSDRLRKLAVADALKARKLP